MELEVLAPAGDRERLLSALNYGADAVYLGRKQFGMRASSGNFDFEGLKEAVKLSHEKGVKVFLTCNTLPRNNEIPLFHVEVGTQTVFVRIAGKNLLTDQSYALETMVTLKGKTP